ncbi:MAG: GGDEF domain-containing protein [Eubacterium sp.]|nr:GGDEF domain-containing protein [Eubacterium sp.]
MDEVKAMRFTPEKMRFEMNTTVNEKTKTNAFVESALIDTFSKILSVNVNTGEFEVFKNDGLLAEDVLKDAPDIYSYMKMLISNEIIYPEYATTCRRFTNPEYVRKSVFGGEKRIVQSYRRRTAKGDKWVTLTVITGNDCTPENPYVLFTWREADSDSITLLDTLPTISSLYDKLIRINLSNNTYEPVIVDADEQERLSGGVINMYEWWAGYSKDGNIANEDMGEFGTLTRTGSLQKRFAEDPTPVSFRYRRKQGDEFRWVQLEIAPSVEYSEDNQIMLLSLKDVHDEYTEQIRSREELIDNMSRDALTDLFNRLKFNRDLEALAKSEGPLFTCLYIDVNGLHELNNLLGHQKGDDMLSCIAETLKKHFPDENIYRIGGDEFVVTSTQLSGHSMGHIIENVRRELLKDNYEISIGIASGVCDKKAEKIVAAAELEMRNDKAAYYMRHGDRRKKRQMNEELEQMLVKKHDSERFLDIIAHQFSGVYLVDLATNISRQIYLPEFFSKLLEETDDCFGDAVQLYVERFVKPEYRDRFEPILDYDKLDEMLIRDGIVQFTFQKTDGIWMNARILEVDREKNAKPETIWIFAEEQHR